MKARVIRAHGGFEALEPAEVPLPEPGAGEVRVRLQAMALNHLDLWVRRGVPGHTFPLPLIPGSDGCGRIEEVGPGVERARLGETVVLSPGYGCGECPACRRGEESLCRDYAILGESRDGTCAEAIVLPARALLAVPEGLDPEEAVALPLVLMTAWRMLVGRARVEAGETVLVQGAGSGIGSTAIQIAAARGCRVIAVTSDPHKTERARALGAGEVIVFGAEDPLAAVRRLTARRGVDVVVEHIGAATWETSVRALARGGRLVTCGATSGAEVRVDLRPLFFKQLSILGSTMGGLADLREAWAWVAAGRIRPVIDRRFRLEQLAEAHRYLEERRAFGKVVVRIAPL